MPGPRRPSPATVIASALLALVVGLTVTAIVVAHDAHRLTVADLLDTLLLVIPYAIVGSLVARRQPRNAVGWVLLLGAVFFTVSTAAAAYSVLDYRQRGGSLPLGPLAVIAEPSWAPAIVLMGIAVLLFPDARVPLGRWRVVLWTFLGCAALWMTGAYAIAVSSVVSGSVVVAPSGDLVAIDHPTGAAAVWGVGQDVFFPVLAIAVLCSIARQVAMYRLAAGERRQQLKLLLYGATVFIVCVPFALQNGSSSLLLRVVSDVASVGFAALPVAIGLAILKYRLFEIDRLISRTVSYTAVTALLAAGYAGLVALTTRVLPFSSAVGVAVSTLAAVAMFNPLRRRVQRVVDRRFNRARYDAERTIAAFAGELRGSVDLEQVRLDLVNTVRAAVQPTSATLWLRGPVGDGAPPP